jgi:hypothetical protein
MFEVNASRPFKQVYVRGANCLSFISAFKTVKLVYHYATRMASTSTSLNSEPRARLSWGFYFRNTSLIIKMIVPCFSFKSLVLTLFQIYGTWYFYRMMN